mmetsp:Transcript_20994/g.30082  ORF Transcript_20994/g.30082 Transcript_20994/m.30082 type:complete len:157 (+) Transcript_20994:697-1167(+)
MVAETAVGHLGIEMEEDPSETEKVAETATVIEAAGAEDIVQEAEATTTRSSTILALQASSALGVVVEDAEEVIETVKEAEVAGATETEKAEEVVDIETEMVAEAGDTEIEVAAETVTAGLATADLLQAATRDHFRLHLELSVEPLFRAMCFPPTCR